MSEQLELQWDNTLATFLLHLKSTWRVDKTLRWYREKLQALYDYLRSSEPPMTIDTLSPARLADFFRHLRDERHLKPPTIRGYWMTIRRFLRWYFEDLPDGDRILRALLKNLCEPPCPRQVVEALAPDELRRVLATAKDKRDYTILLVLAGTGLRAGELINLEVGDVDLHRGQIFVRRAGFRSPGRTKLNAERVVPVKDLLRAALSDYMVRYLPRRFPNAGSTLFPADDGRPLNNEKLYRLVRRYLEAAGIEKRQMGPHLLRRTYASLLRANQVHKTDVAELLGHSETTGTRVVDLCYVTAEANRQALGGIPDVLSDAVRPAAPGRST